MAFEPRANLCGDYTSVIQLRSMFGGDTSCGMTHIHLEDKKSQLCVEQRGGGEFTAETKFCVVWSNFQTATAPS